MPNSRQGWVLAWLLANLTVARFQLQLPERLHFRTLSYATAGNAEHPKCGQRKPFGMQAVGLTSYCFLSMPKYVDVREINI